MGMERNKKPAAEFRREIKSWSEMYDAVNAAMVRCYLVLEGLDGGDEAPAPDAGANPAEEGMGPIVPEYDCGLGQSGSAD